MLALIYIIASRGQISPNVYWIRLGRFHGRYLCEDINRFNEPCVLKEFAPQVQGTAFLTKAQELFEREAGVMYQLQHPQIPRFREMFRVNRGGVGQFWECT